MANAKSGGLGVLLRKHLSPRLRIHLLEIVAQLMDDSFTLSGRPACVALRPGSTPVFRKIIDHDLDSNSTQRSLPQLMHVFFFRVHKPSSTPIIARLFLGDEKLRNMFLPVSQALTYPVA